MYSVEFNKQAKTDILKIIDKEEARVDNFIKIEQNALSRLPIAFQDKTELTKFLNKKHELNDRKFNLVQSEIFNENMLVVSCGRFIKYKTIDLEIV
jgi:mRNA-degrading endonuclease RelE of RelBE toxin-antitoxin system